MSIDLHKKDIIILDFRYSIGYDVATFRVYLLTTHTMNAYFTPSLTDTSVPMPQSGQIYIVASSLEEANEKFDAYLEEKGYYEAEEQANIGREKEDWVIYTDDYRLRELCDEEVENIDPKKIINIDDEEPVTAKIILELRDGDWSEISDYPMSIAPWMTDEQIRDVAEEIAGNSDDKDDKWVQIEVFGRKIDL